MPIHRFTVLADNKPSFRPNSSRAALETEKCAEALPSANSKRSKYDSDFEKKETFLLMKLMC